MSMISLNTNMMAVNTGRNLALHYSSLSNSVRHLSSGLRVQSSADDAAGLAIRELMRADIRAMGQGLRNVNDGISMIQTADGALAVIDEKLIRMKELAEQAATGTYDSTQRLLINNEFQAMADEIDRIAHATEFNGIKLLDGSRKGRHDGSTLESQGAMKLHFGSGNDAAEDYYHVSIGDATLAGLGLSTGNGWSIWDSAGLGFTSPDGYSNLSLEALPNIIQIGDRKAAFFEAGAGMLSVLGLIPVGSTNVKVSLADMSSKDSWDGIFNGVFAPPSTGNDTIQLFTASGVHIAGTTLGTDGWGPVTAANINERMKEKWGFAAGAAYDGSQLNGGSGSNFSYTEHTAGNTFSYGGMNIGYSGDGNVPGHPPLDSHNYSMEYLTIDEVKEDLVFTVSSESGRFMISFTWDGMPYSETSMQATGGSGRISIPTQALAQQALTKLDMAIERKDKIRAHLGALQNRLENTATNMQVQAENLQAAESRISDTDVAQEMTSYGRKQVLASSASAMLTQANSIPRMLMQLLG